MARRREFEEDDVLEKALHVFWEKGFDTASLADLQRATGLTKSSLYKAFESKEGIFRRVLERYTRNHLAFRDTALALPTPRMVANSLLNGIINLHTGKNTPSGCLVTFSALACSTEALPMVEELSKGRNEFEQRLRARFDEIRDAGPLLVGMSTAETASFLLTFTQGLAIQARGGATRRQLRQLVAAVMKGWPADSMDSSEATS